LTTRKKVFKGFPRKGLHECIIYTIKLKVLLDSVPKEPFLMAKSFGCQWLQQYQCKFGDKTGN
jgi:hypothetical protein